MWCDAGNVESIRYLSEDKKTEYTETTARAGMKGWIEFTISKTKNGQDFASGASASLFASGYTGTTVDTTTASDGSWCKAYFAFSIADNDTYVIKQGTIELTAPEAGAKADSKVTLSNIKQIVRRNAAGIVRKPQFTANDAVWLTMTGRDNKLTSVTSFSAGKTYYALVKLDPYGNYYFNSDSVKNIKVPGASSFTITYQKAGANAYTKEDGWYLFATFPKVEAKTFYLQVGYDKSEITANKNDKTYLTATSSCDLTKAKDVSVKWYYSKDISKDKTGEICSASDGDLKLQLDTSTVGTGYYKCEISCTLDGKTAIVSYPGSEWVKLTVKEKTSTTTNPLKLSPVGKQNIDITEAYQTIDFEVKASNANGEVRYKWYYCDASGKIIDETPIGDGQAVLIHEITGKTGEKFYYKCVATDSKSTASLVFSCTIKYKNADTDTSKPDTDTDAPDTSTPDTDDVPVVDTDTDTPDIDTDTSTSDTSEDSESTDDSTGVDSTGGNDSSTDSIDKDDPTKDPSEDPKEDPEDPEDQEKSGSKLWLIILIIVIVLCAAAGVVFFVIKKKQKT